LPFDHLSETLYSSDPCTFASTSVGEPLRIFTRLAMKYFSPRSIEEALNRFARTAGSRAGKPLLKRFTRLF
jgi:hypothetical protein